MTNSNPEDNSSSRDDIRPLSSPTVTLRAFPSTPFGDRACWTTARFYGFDALPSSKRIRRSVCTSGWKRERFILIVLSTQQLGCHRLPG